MTRWVSGDTDFDIVPDMTDDPVLTVVVTTPSGSVTLMAEPTKQGRTLLLDGFHARDSRANAIGAGHLMVLGQAMMERLGLDELVINGAVRTTGANPGRAPRNLRFTRRVRPAPPGG
jgi:hypothetical protein